MSLFSRPTSKQMWLAASLSLITFAFWLYAIPTTRAVQCALLAIPFIFINLADTSSHQFKKIIRFCSWSALILIWCDTGIRGYLWHIHDTDPISGFVVESVANTSLAEGAEYFSQSFWNIVHWLLVTVFVCVLGTLVFCCSTPAIVHRHLNSAHKRTRFIALFITIILLIGSLVGWAIRPWRTHATLLYWPTWFSYVTNTKNEWHNIKETLEKERQVAKSLIIKAPSEAKTIVLVIGESITRDNMSLYGYARNTTPQLENLFRQHKDNFTVFERAWSSVGSTLPAFRSMFQPAQEPQAPLINVFALYRAAGYKVIWLSNQDDLGIEAEYAGHADHKQMFNHLGGRSSQSSDEVLLSPLKEALLDPAKNKLIVLHLIGAHPHYRLRYPSNLKASWDINDAIAQDLEKDRSDWVIDARNQYDLAILHHDKILSRTLELTQSLDTSKNKAWLYVSDHGQEVGHSENRAGHSIDTVSGYRIPALLWVSDSEKAELPQIPLAKRPFRADWLTWTLLDLGDIQWKTNENSRSVLSENYNWQPPKIPLPPSEFN